MLNIEASPHLALIKIKYEPKRKSDMGEDWRGWSKMYAWKEHHRIFILGQAMIGDTTSFSGILNEPLC